MLLPKRINNLQCSQQILFRANEKHCTPKIIYWAKDREVLATSMLLFFQANDFFYKSIVNERERETERISKTTGILLHDVYQTL